MIKMKWPIILCIVFCLTAALRIILWHYSLLLVLCSIIFLVWAMFWKRNPRLVAIGATSCVIAFLSSCVYLVATWWAYDSWDSLRLPMLIVISLDFSFILLVWATFWKHSSKLITICRILCLIAAISCCTYTVARYSAHHQDNIISW